MFDGDEMNMFIPQSVQTQLELANIADVKRQIITPRYSRPIIKFKQDTVLGTYKMTEAFKKLDYHDAMNLIMYSNGVDMFKVKKENTNTHDLYSLIIPANINFTVGDVVVNNGKIVDSEKTKTKGVMGDSILNQKIVYYSWDRHGPDATKNFFDNAQRLVTNWLLMNGFSVGLGDATTDQSVIDDIKSFCEIKQMEVDKLITEMENNPDTLDPETFESNILSTLKASDGEITKRVFEHLKKNQKQNNFYVMIESKAKGSQGNIGQIIGGLGQNVLEFRRIKKKVNNRTLPHFFQNDDRAFARGFIPNSYYHGLTPKEFFFHHMTAREGMIDTSLKTADSGYMQRKLIKGMEDVMMTYDKTVRSGNNVLMQVIYGDNGINQTHYKEVEFRLINMGNKEVEKTFCFSQTEQEQMCLEFKLSKKDFERWNKDLANYMCAIRDDIRRIQMKARMNYITMQSAYQLPVNMNRIVEDAKNLAFNGKQERPSPLYIMHAINYILRPDITKISLIGSEYDKTSIKYGDQDRAKTLFRIALMEYLNPRRCIYEYGLTKIQFDQMVVEIIKSFRKACVEPGEMVGVLTAQSLGETLTQMTLNSVSWNDQIYYTNGTNISKVTKIGEMIDKLLEENKPNIVNVDNNTETEYLDISNLGLKVQSVDENGKMHWKLIEAITRHLPGGNVVKVKTESGREVVATKAKSFLVRRNNKIVEIEGSEIKIGDRLPVQKRAPKLDQYLDYLDLSNYLSKDEYIYGSEMQKAIHHRDTCGKRTWFSDGIQNNVFTTPFKRSDTLVDATKNNPYLLTSNIVIPTVHAMCSSKLTEQIKLDELSGFFFGAYLAEGTVSNAQVIISNNDESYRNKIAQFADRYEIKYHTQIQNDKNFQGATSSDIRLHSTMLVKIIYDSCGKYSENKYVPEWAYIANDEFVKGLLDGYFSGDGTVNKRDIFISASSASKQLLVGISELLTRFDIISKISQHIVKSNNIGSKNIKPVNTLSIRNKNVNTFAEKIGFTIVSKQEIAEKSYEKEWTTQNGQYDIIPGVNIGKLKGNYYRNDLVRLYDKTSNNDIKNILKDTLNEDVYYDKIVSIDEMPLNEITPEHDKVYDLTVADTRNFNMFGGLCMRDTFHSTGVGVKGMQGIPRFREILSYSKKIQTPYMIIKLVPGVRSEQNIAHKIEAYLKHTIFGNLIERMDIIYDPTPDNTLITDNINKDSTYYINGGSAGLENLPWLYKFTISRESMLENDISLLDIKTKFIKYWEDYQNNSSVTKKKVILSKVVNGCIMSNFDNSESPVIHIRYDINTPDNYTLVEIGQYMLNNISIKGVATIEKVDRVDKQKVIEYDDDMSIKPTANEWVIYTTGIDLNKIKTIKHIDFESVYLNDIYMTYLNFGIEAARNLIVRETDNLYNGSGNPLNVTHLALLADVMTNTGNITSIDRHGINRLDTDPLSRASFEKTVEQLLMASAFNEVDHMRSVSSRIMAGRCIKGGTGICEIMVDNDIIENSEYGTQASSISSNGVNLESNPQIEEIATQKVSTDETEVEQFNIFMP
jgi:DNA-directed RNA polymerase beta' subunit